MTTAAPTTTTLFVGTYPSGGPEGTPGTGEGIWRLALDTGTGEVDAAQVAEAPAPSFLALTADGRTLFAAAETSPGMVLRYAVGPDGTLTERQRVASGGSGPCHLLLHPDERALYVANYGSGSVGVLLLEPDAEGSAFTGGVTQVFEHRGTGPHPERQEGPHAHSTILAPDGRHLLALDLGTDEVVRYRLEDDGRLTADGVAARLAPGSGPRHAAVGPGGHLYVVGELSATVHVLTWDATSRSAREVGSQPACRTSVEGMLPAHVVVDGDRVLVSVRGADVLAVFRIEDGGASLRHETDLSLPGAWPRHFATVDGRLVVGLQNSARVVALDDGGTPSGTAAIDHPACVIG